VSLVVTGASPHVATSVGAADPIPESRTVSVYPNPVSHGSHVTIQADLDQAQHYVVGLYDLMGRNVASVQEGYDTRIDVTYQVPAQLASGTYFLRIRGEHIHTTRSLTLF
jgi:hypothetical protein